MASLKNLLNEIAARTEATENEIDGEFRELGEVLLGQAPPGGGQSEVKELFARARETRELIEQCEANADRLQKLLDQLAEVNEAIKEKQGELKILKEEVEPHYEKVGRAAAESLLDEDLEGTPHRALIDQVRTLDSEIKQLNREIGRIGQNEEEQGIVGQALAGGRKLYRQGVLRSKTMRAESLYRRLGQEVCETDLITHLNSRAFVDVLEPVLKNKEQAKKIDAQLASLKNKAERLDADIAAASEGERPHRRLQHLEEDRAAAREVYEVQLRDLGARYADHPGSATAIPAKAKSLLGDIKTLRKELGSLAARRERVQAAIALEELDRKVESSRSRVRGLETSVKKANAEIAELSAEIKRLNEEREKLLAVRGSADDLAPEPVEDA